MQWQAEPTLAREVDPCRDHGDLTIAVLAPTVDRRFWIPPCFASMREVGLEVGED